MLDWPVWSAWATVGEQARAHEVGGDAAHLESSAASLETAGTSASLWVHVDTMGSGGRHWRLRKNVKADAEKVVGAVPGRSSKWDLMAVVSANSEKCAQTKEKKVVSKEFVAGTKQVPNPAFAEVSDALDTAEGALDAVDTDLDEAKSALATAQAEQKALEDGRVHKQRLVDEASKTPRGHQRSSRPTRPRWPRPKTRWPLSTPSSTPRRPRPSLPPTRTLRSATAWPRRAPPSCRSKKKTDEELTEKIMETAKVDETTWTTTCDAPATVLYATRWNAELDKKQVVEASNQTTDVSRPAHEGAEIEADEEAYPKSKDELVAELDVKVQGEVAKSLEGFVAEPLQPEVGGCPGQHRRRGRGHRHPAHRVLGR